MPPAAIAEFIAAPVMLDRIWLPCAMPSPMISPTAPRATVVECAGDLGKAVAASEAGRRRPRAAHFAAERGERQAGDAHFSQNASTMLSAMLTATDAVVMTVSVTGLPSALMAVVEGRIRARSRRY